MKTCSKCNELTPLTNFYNVKRGLYGKHSMCKPCIKVRDALIYKHNAEHLKQQAKDYRSRPEVQLKLQSSDYKARKKVYNQSPEAKARTQAKRDTLEFKAKKRAYHRRSEVVIKCLANSAKRRASKLNATPKWLTLYHHETIKNLYSEAKRLESVDEIKRHVDHIVPLQGENVCGLHVPWNLQILTEKENISKSNKLIF